MFNFSGYRTGLRAAVGMNWPEVLPAASGGGVFTVPRVEQVAFEDLDVPLAVIQHAEPRVSEEWSGVAGQAYTCETMFHYVRRRDLTTDVEEAVEAKLVLLANYLLHNALPFGQCVDVLGINALESNELNAVLLEKNKAHYGGTLTTLMLVGEWPA